MGVYDVRGHDRERSRPDEKLDHVRASVAAGLARLWLSHQPNLYLAQPRLPGTPGSL